jgi:hypothetical protein
LARLQSLQEALFTTSLHFPQEFPSNETTEIVRMAAKAAKHWHTSAVLNMLCEKSASTNAVDFCRKRSSPGIWALEIAQRDAEIFRSEGMPSRMDKSPPPNRPGLHDKSRAFSEGHNFKIEATCDG